MIWRDEGQLTGEFLKALKVSLVKVKISKILTVGQRVRFLRFNLLFLSILSRIFGIFFETILVVRFIKNNRVQGDANLLNFGLLRLIAFLVHLIIREFGLLRLRALRHI